MTRMADDHSLGRLGCLPHSQGITVCRQGEAVDVVGAPFEAMLVGPRLEEPPGCAGGEGAEREQRRRIEPGSETSLPILGQEPLRHGDDPEATIILEPSDQVELRPGHLGDIIEHYHHRTRVRASQGREVPALDLPCCGGSA